MDWGNIEGGRGLVMRDLRFVSLGAMIFRRIKCYLSFSLFFLLFEKAENSTRLFIPLKTSIAFTVMH